MAPLEGEIAVYERSGNEAVRQEVRPPLVMDDPSGFKTGCDEAAGRGTSGVNLVGSPVFTPDAQAILVAVYCGAARLSDGALSFPRNAYSRLYRVPLHGGTVAALPLGTNLRSDSRPRLSPDGSRIAVPGSSYVSICFYTFDFSVANVDGTDVAVAPLTDLKKLYEQADRSALGGGIFGGVIGFDWAPQSDALVASVDASVCNDFAPQEALAGLYILKLGGSQEEKLVDGPAHSPAWSPSGRYIAYVSGRTFGGSTEPSQIRIFDLNSHQIIDLTQGAQPAWQPRQ